MTYFSELPLSGSYRTVYADPPWNETGAGVKGGRRGADRHYPLMKTRDIAALPVPQVCASDAHLYLWITNSFLEDGLAVMRAWGFQYRTLLTWGKDRFGLGQYYRGQTEHVIFAVRGMLPYRHRPDGKRAQGTTLVLGPRREHSRKPEEMRRMIEVVSHPPYIELFSRGCAEGWDAWGNEPRAEIQASLGLMAGTPT